MTSFIRLKLSKSETVGKLLLYLKAIKWAYHYSKNSGTHKTSINVCLAKIAKTSHMIEKGLAFDTVKPNFGKVKIINLINEINFIPKEQRDNDAIRWAYKTMIEYVNWHLDNDFDCDLAPEINGIIDEKMYFASAGVERFNNFCTELEKENFKKVISTRRSLRSFSSEVVDLDMIKSCVLMADNAPSVCNRRPWFTKTFQNKASIQKLLALQNGNTGFGDEISTLIVVGMDLNKLFDRYEIFEGYIDSGLYVGLLVNILHSYGIGSCCLNLCVSENILHLIRKEAQIESDFQPVMFIAVGKPKENAVCAVSPRINAKHIF
jgi:nitroreductase